MQLLTLKAFRNILYNHCSNASSLRKSMEEASTQYDFISKMFPEVMLINQDPLLDTSNIWNSAQRISKIMNGKCKEIRFFDKLISIISSNPNLFHDIEKNMLDLFSDCFLKEPLSDIFSPYENEIKRVDIQLYNYIFDRIKQAPETALAWLVLYALLGDNIRRIKRLYSDPAFDVQQINDADKNVDRLISNIDSRNNIDITLAEDKQLESQFINKLAQLKDAEFRDVVNLYSNMFYLSLAYRDIASPNKIKPRKKDFIAQLCEYIKSNVEKHNLIKISGSCGTGKDLLLQIMCEFFVRTYSKQFNFQAFYINLNDFMIFNDSNVEDILDAVKNRIKSMVEDICSLSSNKIPILFVNGIKNHYFTSYNIEDAFFNAFPTGFIYKKIIAVDNDYFYANASFRNRNSLATKAFSYEIEFTQINIYDEPRCLGFLDCASKLLLFNTEKVYDSLKRFHYYDFDIRILKLMLSIENDDSENSGTIYDLYDRLWFDVYHCTEIDINYASSIAYDFVYKGPVSIEQAYPLLKTSCWNAIIYHKSFIENLVARFYLTLLSTSASEKNKLMYLRKGKTFEKVLPKEITNFISSIISNSNEFYNIIIDLCKSCFNDANIFIKDQLSFLLGRINSRPNQDDSLTLLQCYYDKTKNEINERDKTQDYSENSRPFFLLLLRGLAVSMIYKGVDDVLDEYITMLLNDKMSNAVNISYHLQYYGDKEFCREKSGLVLDEDVTIGNKTFKYLSNNIKSRFHTPNGPPILELELFTLCTMLQSRINSMGCNNYNYNLDKTLSGCIEFLKQYRLHPNFHHVTNPKIKSYFEMVLTDFEIYSNTEERNYPICNLYNTCSRSSVIPRTGWLEIGIENPEDIANHMYSAWLIAMLFLPDSLNRTDYDKSRILNMLLIHDLAETLTGDISKFVKFNNKDYEIDEDLKMKSLLIKDTYLSGTSYNSYYELWEEWRKRDSINAKIAKDIDVIQAVYQFCCYYCDYSDSITDARRDLWLAEKDNLKTEIGRDIFNQIITRNSTFNEFICNN